MYDHLINSDLVLMQVTHNSHRYLKEVEMREEGGTPGIVESIRAGLVFQLKEVSLFIASMLQQIV